MRLAVSAVALFCAATGALATPRLTNGDFEGSFANNVPQGWTEPTSPEVTYTCNGYVAEWQNYSTTLNGYPPLDVYAGTKSLGTFRADGVRVEGTNCPWPGPNYEVNILYQNIAVNPSTIYYVKVSAAVFLHHDRQGDYEDYWGEGASLRICAGANVIGSESDTDTAVVWRHSFWNWEGDSFWRYYPTVRNQRYGESSHNYFTTGPSQTSVTFVLLWLTKWNENFAICAFDNVQCDLSTTGPEPTGSDTYTAKNPPTWVGGDPRWSPTQKPPEWCKAGETNGGDQFYQSEERTTGLYPRNSAIGDLNGDGLLDIAVADSWSHLISIYLQKPAGGFELKSHLGGAVYPTSVQIGQVVGGPALDLAVSSAGKYEVAVFPGNGDGTFGAPYTVSTSWQPTWLALGDFNNNGQTDFVVGVQRAGSGSEIHCYLGNGSGGFTHSHTLATGFPDSPSCIIAADLGDDGTDSLPDGNLDIAALSWGGDVYSFVGYGNGTFQYGRSYGSCGAWKSTAMAVANLDEDPSNIPDICVGYMWEADYAQLLQGRGDCTFSGQSCDNKENVWMRPGRFPSGVDIIDFNQDTHPDFAFSNYASSDVVLYKNLGFSAGWRYEYFNHFGVGRKNTHILASDLNADGYKDLIVTGGWTQTVNVIYGGPNGAINAPRADRKGVCQAGAIADFITSDSRLDIAVDFEDGGGSGMRVYRNDGNLSFTEVYSNTIIASGGICLDLSSADLNSDGKADFAATWKAATGTGSWWVYLGDGAGGFTRTQYTIMSGNSTQDTVLANVDNVNGPDLIGVEAQLYYEGVYCRQNNGAGGFGAGSAKRTTLPQNSKPRDLDAGDFNSDGKQDVVVAFSAGNKFGLLTGRGDGYFNSPVYLSAGTETSGICAGDFNGDGKQDVAVINKGADTLMVFLGNGAGSFGSPKTIAVGDEPTHVQTHDFNVDGKSDLIVSNAADKTFCVLRGNGDGTFQSPQYYRTTETPYRFAVGDLRGIGVPDLFAAVDGWAIYRNALLSTGSITVTDDGASQTFTDHISGGWTATTGPGRTILRYRWAVSTTPDTTGIVPGGGWQYTTSAGGTRSITLSEGQTYYILAQAEDSANLWTPIGAADGITVQQPVSVGTAAEAKRLEDGRAVILSGAIVSRVWSGSPWVCYVQDADRASGIRVQGTGAVPMAGQEVTVTGVMSSLGRERMISASNVITGATPGEPAPLETTGRGLGGGDFEYTAGPPMSGQVGVLDGYGANNIGLLVRTSGRVTRSETGEDFFYLDDGSNLEDGFAGGLKGVRCTASGLTKPAVGEYRVVTGVSGAIEIGGSPVRCVRVQRQGDIAAAP